MRIGLILMFALLLAGCGSPKSQSAKFQIYIFAPNEPSLVLLASELELPLDQGTTPLTSSASLETHIQQIDLNQAVTVIDESMLQSYDWTHQVLTLTNPLAPQSSATFNTRGVFVLVFNDQRFLVGNIVSEMAASSLETPVMASQPASRLNDNALLVYKLRASSYELGDATANLADIIGNADLAQQIHDHFKGLGKLK